MEKRIIDAGWISHGIQKSKCMQSFGKGYLRMNVYLTTGTITIQNTQKRYDKGKIYKNVDDVLLEKILNENY